MKTRSAPAFPAAWRTRDSRAGWAETTAGDSASRRSDHLPVVACVTTEGGKASPNPLLPVIDRAHRSLQVAAGGAAAAGALGPRADAGGRRDAGRAHASLAASSRRDRQGLCRLPLLPGSRRAAGGGESMGKVWALAWPRRALVDGPRLGERPPRRPSPPTSWPPTRTNRRSRGGRPASSTRAGAPCSKARRWPTCPRATSCAARRSSSPTDGATPGPRPSRPSSAEATPRSWSPIPAGRAGETARAGGVRRPVTAIRPQRAGGCHPEGRSASGGRRSR